MININEYLLSKANTEVHGVPPMSGCTIDDIVEWLESCEIKRSKKYQDPKHGEIIYEVGPCREANKYNKNYYWVALRSCPEKKPQSVIAKPYAQSYYLDKDEVEHKLDFDDAIELMDKIIKNPYLVL